ncbi:unnamed protein product, partial [Rangifer tarandus platyrhynchus]
MAYSEKQGGVPCGFIRQNSGNSIPLDFEPDAEHQFVEQLQERSKRAFCRCVLHPTAGCGHRFRHHCVLSPRDERRVPLCPVDKEVIKSQEVFKDNCCTREVLSLYAFCKTKLQDVMPRLFWGDTRTAFSPARSGLCSARRKTAQSQSPAK